MGLANETAVSMPSQRKIELLQLKGSWIKVRLRDVCFPPAEELLTGPSGDSLLEGLVLDVSDGGPLESCFLELELRGSCARVIVKAARGSWT